MIEFEEVKGKFVFNITNPFKYKEETLMAGRNYNITILVD